MQPEKKEQKRFYLKWPWDLMVYALLVVLLRVFSIPVILLLVLAVMIWQTYLNMRSAKRDREMVAYRNDVLLEFKRRADAIIAKASGKSYEKTVESAVDSVLSMPMRSKEDTLGMDKEVIAKMDELLSVIGTDDDGAVDYICRQLKDAVLRRNTQFKKDQM